jgi:heme exporter protein B
MPVLKTIQLLLTLEGRLEWRQRYSINAVFIYLLSTVFITYLAFYSGRQVINLSTWISLLWIILLFINTYAIFRSFHRENTGHFFYYYQVAHPASIISAKLIFNGIFALITTSLTFVSFAFFLGEFDIPNLVMLYAAVLVGGMSISFILTTVSAIAAKTSNSGVLTAILGFPLVMPCLLLGIRSTLSSLNGSGIADLGAEWLQLTGLSAIAISLSLILFPYLWKS